MHPPRTAQQFEIPEEDLLTERPAVLTAEQLLEMEIEPPGWALKCITKIGGKRYPKQKRITGYQPAPIVPWGPMHQPSYEETEAYQRAIERHRQKHGRGSMPSVDSQVPPGNLEDNDYRYWHGYALAGIPRYTAQCRWCEAYSASQKFMKAHHNDGCKELLTALYRYAKHQSRTWYCFACKKLVHTKKWGVPLCKSVSCISAWKFSFNDKLMGFMFYRNLALTFQKEDPDNAPFAGLKMVAIDDDDPYGPYCVPC